jgi:hypothetical protein
MIPHYPILPGAEAGSEPHLRWYLVEKPGLDVTHISGHDEELLEE